MIRFLPVLIAVTLLATVSACSTGNNPGLPISHDLGPITAQHEGGLAVMLDAPVWLWDERIRYRLLYQDATVIHYYNLDRWEAPLPALLERRLTIHSEQPFVVQIQLTQFEQQFKTIDQAQVVMSLTVSVFANKDHRLIDKHLFELSQPSPSPDATGAIAGFIALTEQANTGIQSWLATLSNKYTR